MNTNELIGTSTSNDGHVFFHWSEIDNRHSAAEALANAYINKRPFSWIVK